MKNIFQAGTDTTGVVSLLVGLIVIVFVALGVSLVLDQDMQFFSGQSKNSQWRDQNERLESRITHLELQLAASQKKIPKAATHREQLAELKTIRQQAQLAGEESALLKKQNALFQPTISQLEKSKSTYRQRYRDHVRLQGIGKKFPSITSRVGRVYHEVQIKDVSPLGIQISHRDGGALLEYEVMPEDWRTRFQYTALEFAKAKMAEEKRLKAYYAAVAQSKKTIRKRTNDKNLQQQIIQTRRKVSEYRHRLNYVIAEASIAQHKADAYNRERETRYRSRSYSYRTYNSSTGRYTTHRYRPRYRISLNRTSRTIPGSLTTWQERADQMKRKAAYYRSTISSLQSKLLSIDPSYQMPIPQRSQR